MSPAPKDELEAAYFTLLRAREELAAVQRYGEYLEAERRRLTRFTAEGDALEAHVAPKLRRAIGHTDAALGKAIRARIEVIDNELARLPDRLAAAQGFVEECETEHSRLRAR